VTEVDYHEAATLREAGLTWKQIAEKLDYTNWAKSGKSRKEAADRIRVNVQRLRSNPATPSHLDGDK
jgi:hypothetical protein